MLSLPDNWKALLGESLAPLHGGARQLQVGGWQPPGKAAWRPERTAAVLVGVLDLPQPQIILTRRAQHLKQHAGQVSLPGGAADENDKSGVVTALREAEEEIALRPGNVHPLGFLDRIDTFTNFRVLPVVGLVAQREPLIPDLNEVDKVFTLPLAMAISREAWSSSRVVRDGRSYTLYSMEWEGNKVWGITAAILMNLAERMAPLLADAGLAGSTGTQWEAKPHG